MTWNGSDKFKSRLFYRVSASSVNFKMGFWGRRFPPKNERKQINLKYHSSKVEFVRSFFGGNR